MQCHVTFTCATFSMGYCVVGDSEGSVTIIQCGELIDKLDATAMVDKGHEDQSRLLEAGNGRSLVDISPCGRGFVTVTCGGVLSLFTTGDHSRCGNAAWLISGLLISFCSLQILCGCVFAFCLQP